MTRDDAFRQQLMQTFKAEFDGYVSTLNKGFLTMEQAPSAPVPDALVAELFRAAHSMKGAASVVGLDQIKTMAHSLEDVLAALRDGQITPSAKLVDELLFVVDELAGAMLASLAGRRLTQARVNGVLNVLQAALVSSETTDAVVGAAPAGPFTGGASVEIGSPAGLADRPDAAPSDAAAGSSAPFTESTVRVSIAKLDALLEGVGEMITNRLRFEQALADLMDAQRLATQVRRAWRRARGPIARPRATGDPVGFASARGTAPIVSGPQDLWRAPAIGGGAAQRVTTRQLTDRQLLGQADDSLAELVDDLEDLTRRLSNDVDDFAQLSSGLLDAVLQARMVPLARLFESLPRVVRDLAHDVGKRVGFELQGAEIEVDRRVLELARDPLIHLLTNAVDHGIEIPEGRARAGKPERGAVILRGSQEGGMIVLEVQDDGGGIDLARVREVAAAQGKLSHQAAAQLSDAEALDLIFVSGISTAVQVTTRSGRGVGLDVVRQNVQALHGAVNVESTPGRGTTFTLRLPLTLATAQVMLVSAGGRRFGLPATAVDRIVRVDPAAIGMVEARPVVRIDGQPLRVVSLAAALELPPAEMTASQDDSVALVIVGTAAARLALQVDAVSAMQEVVVKSLGPQLRRVPNVSGATVLGDGDLVLVLNVADLAKSARAGVHAGPAALDVRPAPLRRRRILVVDDSITSRTLERNILEGAGYDVVVAADGLEAWALVQAEQLDAAVVDVDMPEMNGLELTAKIRGDERYAVMPVILVTSMASRRDQIRGLEAGASAYITKGSFDQDVLLETIERLT